MKQVTKVFLAILVITSMVLTLTACGSSEDVSNEDVTYEDGTYYGEGEHGEFGYEAAEVTVENGEITDIVLMRMTPEDEEVDYEEWTGEDERPNLKQAKEDLAEQMVEQQTYGVDVIATATQSSEGWKDAVENALSEAQ